MPSRPIVFTIDNRYIRPLAVALASLERQCRADRVVVVAHDGLHPLHRWLLARRFGRSRLHLRFLRLPLPAERRRQPHHFSPAILLRLALAKVIEAPSFVYVDADVLFTGDPAALDHLDLGGSTLAAAAWSQSRDLRATGHGVLPRYFASSLLVIDRARFLAEGTGERALALIARHRFDFPDQDALNLCCGAWQALPEEWCLEMPDQGRALAAEPVGPLLLQFSGSEKPWHPFSRHPCRRIFHRHLRRTPYRFFPPGPADLRWRSLGSRLRQRLLSRARSSSRSTSA